MHSTYDFFKDFSGSFATVVASIAAVCATIYFARKQAWLAAEKIRYDLFDRRLRIFESIFDFYRAMYSWIGSPEQIATRDQFYRGYQESAFLFSKGSGIEMMLKDFYDDANKVIAFRENGESYKKDNELYLRLLKESSHIQTFGAEEKLAKLKSAISAYLNFEDFKR